MKRNKLIQYIQNGSQSTNYFPKSKTENNMTTEGSFFFTGKISTIQRFQKNKYSHTEIEGNQPSKNHKSSKKQLNLASKNQISLPQLSLQSYRDSIKGSEKINEYVVKLDTDYPNYAAKSLPYSYYRKEPSQVEKFQSQLKVKNRKLNHIQLISKNYKNQLGQIPAIGVYNPSFEQQDKHKPIAVLKGHIKYNQQDNSSQIQKDDQQLNKDERKQGEEKFEVLYARTLKQINKEVDEEKKRNPTQFLHPYEICLQPVMSQQEAVDHFRIMKQNFKQMKDTLAKIKNMINEKR